jgi:hypothetical protein
MESKLFVWHTPGTSKFILIPQELILHFFYKFIGM